MGFLRIRLAHLTAVILALVICVIWSGQDTSVGVDVNALSVNQRHPREAENHGEVIVELEPGDRSSGENRVERNGDSSAEEPDVHAVQGPSAMSVMNSTNVISRRDAA
jgi:hypothetical protein